MKEIKVRFAPSPTGPLHIGGARSALFNWLYARHTGGKFVLRIEDTDMERSSSESEEEIISSLQWLGLDIDEGAGVGGDNGPYRQSERLDLYRKYAENLLQNGQAYYCYCTGEELAAERETCLAREEMVRYSGRCRNLTEQDRRKLESEGRKPVLRFKVPEEKSIVINDMVRGRVEFDCEGIGDFVILKSDGMPTYNFAVVIDDYSMGINHVIRAEEHLSNTPRQVLLNEAMGWDPPLFAHISLILGKDKAKMSKRHGATSLKQYKETGYLPEAMMNFLALLGWSPGGEEEILDRQELINQFSLDRVVKSPAVFDLEKLNYINGSYIRQVSLQRITELALPFLQEKGYVSQNPGIEDFEKVKSIMSVAREYLNNLSEVNDHVGIFFVEPSYDGIDVQEILKQEQVPGVLESFIAKVKEAESLDESSCKKLIKSLPKELGLGAKHVYKPLRVALTGLTQGPELYQVIPALGCEKTINRMKAALHSAVN
ncbi:MAG: glutamate--tRNA ligase [Clostridiales bacterium]|nr:glutamate--tRNA ligase [Clostridiales bacterium]MCF8023639.1 glutamate--tRNA ligase [Clostridiales bacterium]